MKLQEVSAEIFAQLITVTERLSNEEYTQSLGLLFNNSIGKHLRHIIEFYDLVLTSYASGELNYDLRNRNLALENDRLVAIDKLRSMSVLLEAFPEDKALHLEASYSHSGASDVAILSTFYRELLYNVEHAVHHIAIIRIALEARFPHVALPPHFGVAYSTVQYQNK